jgi:hypothetical protein
LFCFERLQLGNNFEEPSPSESCDLQISPFRTAVTRQFRVHACANSNQRSQTEFERKPLEELQRCVNVVIALEKRLTAIYRA